MSVKILLDQSGKYTNLDVIKGRVILRLFQPSKISYVIVKLEGEARTRLQGVNPDSNRPENFLEIHKLLYKMQRVFPPPNVQVNPREKMSFQLAPGSYEYPFEFKIPFNNSCLANIQAHGPSTPFNMAGFNIEVSKSAPHHVKTTLPPTMHQSQEAGIRYFVKATVNVPSLFKENPRAITYFSFDPIEPPRPKSDGEAYARRQHQFNDNPEQPKRKFSLKLGAAPTPPPVTNAQLARFSIDVRMPNPSVLTCGKDIPLRVLIKQQSPRSGPLYLKTFQIELVGHTNWVLNSASNLHYTIGIETDAEGAETELTRELWAGHTLPDAVCPSFVTCNIERYYELVVSVGLSYGSTIPGQDQFVVLPLRHRVEVFSGIRPPDELLKRVAEQRVRPQPPTQAATAPPGGLPAYSAGPSNLPPGSGQHPEDPYLDAPPSYEDAMAENIRPLDGPRPGYNPQPAHGGAQGGLFDEKS
ncbi:hypothetical protein BT63DRAFT_103317 [Microthyrium microscopicum]|uniref:Arrestin-like N-terminal domain-containing protein n=1 Tax=Microthyrium microscopicum TaxID=703497 RepID=A0A6A6TXN7_9PEZI|nr:hypothetical protein BT63DRAFT_103317 [Microthyrium microscopicum]